MLQTHSHSSLPLLFLSVALLHHDQGMHIMFPSWGQTEKTSPMHIAMGTRLHLCLSKLNWDNVSNISNAHVFNEWE